MEKLNHNPKCPNKTCEGGVLMRNPARPVPCTFCNPSYRPERTGPYTLDVVKSIAMDFHNAHTYIETAHTDAFEVWWAKNRSSYIADHHLQKFKP